MNFFKVILVIYLLSISSIYSWSITSGLKGGFSYGYITSPDASVHVGVDNQFSEIIEAGLMGGYNYNDVIYDGNGNHLFINTFNINGDVIVTPIEKWEISIFPLFSIAKNFTNAGGTLEGKLYAEKFNTGLFAGYSKKSYIYPIGNINVMIDSPIAGIYFTYYINHMLDLNFTGNYNLSIYNTSGSFSEYLLGGGLSWYPDKKLIIGADILCGFDSASYTMLGFDANVVYKIIEPLSFRLDGSFKSYNSSLMNNSTTTQTTGGRPRAGSQTTSSAGGGVNGKNFRTTSSNFNEFYASFGIKYTFDFSKK
ncbi:MAG: hypothetical protein OEV78_03640 [Spirochaetia bacterium]|nr:hypothetical protein [Spirochaetia bacterium]